MVDCLSNEVDESPFVDNLIKFRLFKSSNLFSDSEKTAQSKELDDYHMNNLMKGILVKCEVDDHKKNILNETLEEYQHKYCMAKYAIDNQLLELNINNLNNTHDFDTGSLNCTNIINVERRKTEKEYIDQLSTTETDQKSLECAAIDVFRNGNMFDWKVAIKALIFLHKEGQEMDADINRIAKWIEEYLAMSTSLCNL